MLIRHLITAFFRILCAYIVQINVHHQKLTNSRWPAATLWQTQHSTHLNKFSFQEKYVCRVCFFYLEKLELSKSEVGISTLETTFIMYKINPDKTVNFAKAIPHLRIKDEWKFEIGKKCITFFIYIRHLLILSCIHGG